MNNRMLFLFLGANVEARERFDNFLQNVHLLEDDYAKAAQAANLGQWVYTWTIEGYKLEIEKAKSKINQIEIDLKYAARNSKTRLINERAELTRYLWELNKCYLNFCDAE